MNILLWVAIIIAVIAVVSFSMNWSPYQETRPFKKVWHWLPVFAFASGAVAVDDIFVRSTLVIASVVFVFCADNPEWAAKLLEESIVLVMKLLAAILIATASVFFICYDRSMGELFLSTGLTLAVSSIFLDVKYRPAKT